MADQDHVLQIELFDQRVEIVRVGIHVVAAPGLARATMASTVVRDRAVGVGGHEIQLVIPVIRVERPTVAEVDGLPFAPVLIENAGAVLGRDCASAHRSHSSSRSRSTDSSTSRRMRRATHYMLRADSRMSRLNELCLYL